MPLTQTEILDAINLPPSDSAIRMATKKLRRAHNLEVGLTLAKAGVKVFATLDKSPMVTAWEQDGDAMTRAQRKAIVALKRIEKENPSFTPKFIGCTSDEAKVRDMHAQFPDCVFSIALGPSRLVCLDADLPKEKRPLHGPTELAKLYDEHGGRPAGVFINGSQSGAEHHIFSNPLAVRTSGALADRSIDVKGGGTTAKSGTGQIVAPGSIRQDGKVYGPADAAQKFAQAYTDGLPALPDYVVEIVGAGVRVVSSDASAQLNMDDGDTSSKSNTPESDIAALAQVLRSASAPDISRFDLLGLQSTNRKFGDLLLDPEGESKASDRLAFLNHVVAAYPDITGVEAFALMKANPDVCGVFVNGNQRKGEYDHRNAAKDYLKAMRDTSAWVPLTDGEARNILRLDDYRPHEREQYEYKVKVLPEAQAAEVSARARRLQEAHDALVEARKAEKAIEAEVVQATDSDDTKAKKKADKLSRLQSKFYFGEQILEREMPVFDWAVHGVVARGTTSIMAGRAGRGKTAAAIDLGGHICLGLDWNGRHVERGVVCYVALENPHLVEMRWRAWLTMMQPVLDAKNLKATDAAFILYHAKLGMLSLDGKPTPDERDLIDIAMLGAEHYGCPVSMVIIDTVSKSIRPGNPTEHGALYVMSMQRIAEQTARPGLDVEGANVLAITHPPKSGSSNVGGSYAFEADVDTVLIADEVGKSGSGRYVVKGDEEKFRVCDPSTVRFPYTKKSVEIGRDARNEPQTVMLLDFTPEPIVGPADDDDEAVFPRFKMSDTVDDRRTAILECLDIEARRQKADGQTLRDALKATAVAAGKITDMFNRGRLAAKLTELDRSTVSSVISGMVDDGILKNTGQKGRPKYALAGDKK